MGFIELLATVIDRINRNVINIGMKLVIYIQYKFKTGFNLHSERSKFE